MRVKLDEGAITPTRAHDTDAGADLYTPFEFWVEPNTSEVINTGVHVELPHGHVGMIKSKSGLNVKHGILTEGVIDEGYDGPIVVKLYNFGTQAIHFEAGDKITQLVVMPCSYPTIEVVDEIDGGERGSNGFGSTGAN